jgi:hypothetical protein
MVSKKGTKKEKYVENKNYHKIVFQMWERRPVESGRIMRRTSQRDKIKERQRKNIFKMSSLFSGLCKSGGGGDAAGAGGAVPGARHHLEHCQGRRQNSG